MNCNKILQCAGGKCNKRQQKSFSLFNDIILQKMKKTTLFILERNLCLQMTEDSLFKIKQIQPLFNFKIFPKIFEETSNISNIKVFYKVFYKRKHNFRANWDYF